MRYPGFKKNKAAAAEFAAECGLPLIIHGQNGVQALCEDLGSGTHRNISPYMSGPKLADWLNVYRAGYWLGRRHDSSKG